MNQSVSVAVPTLNAAGRIGSLLEKLKKQTVKPLEILVVIFFRRRHGRRSEKNC